MRLAVVILSSLAFLVACAASAYLLTAPVYQVGSSSGAGMAIPGGPQTQLAAPALTVPVSGAETQHAAQASSQTFAGENGDWVIGLLVGIVLLAGSPLAAAFRFPAAQRPVTWIAALLLLGFSIISILSVGILFMPAALLLVAAAIVSVFINGGSATEKRHGKCN